MNNTLLDLMSLQSSSSSLRAQRSNLNCSQKLLRCARNEGMLIRRRGLICMLVAVLSFSASSIFADEPEKKEDPFRMKTIEGEIAGKTKRNLSVQYRQEGNQFFEAVIPVNEKIKLKGYKTLKDIKDGDVIRAEFKEFYKTDSDGKEIRTGKMATSIQLIKNSTAGKLISKDY